MIYGNHEWLTFLFSFCMFSCDNDVYYKICYVVMTKNILSFFYNLQHNKAVCQKNNKSNARRIDQIISD